MFIKVTTTIWSLSMRRCQMGSRPPDIEDPGHMFHFFKRLNGRDGVMAGYKIITPHSPEEQKNQGNPMEREENRKGTTNRISGQ